MIGRTIEANDLEYLRNMVLQKSDLIPQLRTGDCIVNRIILRQPLKASFRGRYSINI